MSKEMVISANPHETRVAILEEGQLCEYYVEREKEFALVGSIYKGRVTRVLPGMQSAFVEIGLDSDAFLYVSDFLEDVEDVDQIVTTVEDKVQKMEEQGGQVFRSAEPAAPAIEPADVESGPAASAAEPGSGASGVTAANASRPSGETPTQGEPPVGESHDAAAVSSAASQTQTPEQRPPTGGHGRFEHRQRDRRDFGRRGGGRGRHGRGGRGGDRRYGRELPPSKYASPRSPEEPGPSSGYTPVILPGESLAKYRDRGPAAPAAPPTEEFSSGTPAPPERENLIEPKREHAEFHTASPAGFEPLPGETLAKYQPNEPAAAVHPIVPAEPFVESADAREDHADIETCETKASGASEHDAAYEASEAGGLSEEQAATLAAHVTEAQIEEAEAAREREEREAEDFAASDEAAEADAASHETAPDENASEDAELEEEEAQAEAEGMIAPAADAFTEQANIEENETQPALASSDLEPAEPPSPQERQPWKARVRDDFRSRMQHPSRRGRDRGRSPDRGRRDDRGRRPQHGYGHQHRPQPRRPQLIADLLKQGQEIIVQIAKEPLGKKGARITSHVALPGRFLVYMPTLDHTGVSRKIASAEDRARLRHLVNEAKGSAGGGFIVRTAAGSASPEEIRTDVEFLTRTWSEIKARAEHRKAPTLLHRDLNLVERILRDYVNDDYGAIWVDSDDEFAKVVEFMSRFQPDLVNRVKLYTKDTPVFEEFGIQQEIDKGLRPKVWLKSGGYIVINHTEALVAIDVNTGKFVGKGSTRLEDTIVRTNLEAVKEIVRQMRLRDLGGIIIIDFIDMEERRNREKVMAALEDALRADRAPSKVLRFNEFGLVAITRKRTKQALERTLCQPCPYCTGSGMVKSVPTLCYEIQTEARKMAPEMDSISLTVRAHPEIAKALKTRESGLVEELERWTKKSVIIQADPTLHWEQYDIY
jgi:ribonuclease G